MITKNPLVSLIVIQARDIEKSKEFYSLIGLNFSEEKHGAGPRHFASVVNGLVFEICPSPQSAPTAPLRVGFRVAALDSILEILRRLGTSILSEPKDTGWGRRAVVEDPDGNRVELSAEVEESNPRKEIT